MRRCLICGRSPLEVEFGKNARAKDGLYRQCKPCVAEVYAELVERRRRAWADRVIPTEKTCTECKITKPVSEFYSDIKMVDGFTPQCSGCVKHRMKEYYKVSKDKVIDRAKGYYLAHRQERIEYVSNYFREHPEVKAGIESRRRFNGGKGVSDFDRSVSGAYRLAIHDDECFYCGSAGEHDDHFFSLAKGGTDHWFNLVRACSDCNHRKYMTCGVCFQGGSCNSECKPDHNYGLSARRKIGVSL